MAQADWHYPRADLAQQYVEALELGAVTALTLFSPRRTGKTEFLLYDLKPFAETRGHYVIYADLWQDKTNARAALLYALERAWIEVSQPASRVGKLLATPVKKVSALGGEVELGEDRPKAQENPFLRIDELMGAIAKKKKKVLLLIDEVQQLAADRDGDALVAALRSTLTVHKQAVRVVFTGSSRDRLSRLFAQASAPLFGFAAVIDFPLLGEAFIDFICEQFKRATKRSIDKARLNAAFVGFEHRPRPLLDMVVDMVLSAGSDVDAYFKKHHAQLVEADFGRQWHEMSALEQVVLTRVIKNEPLFAKESLEAMRERLGLNKLALAQIQRALGSLTERHVLFATGERGKYQFESAAFADWIRTHQAG